MHLLGFFMRGQSACHDSRSHTSLFFRALRLKFHQAQVLGVVNER